MSVTRIFSVSQSIIYKCAGQTGRFSCSWSHEHVRQLRAQSLFAHFKHVKPSCFPNSAIHIEYIVLLNQFSRTSAIVYMTLVAIFYSYIIVLPRPNPILPGWLWFPKTHPKTNGFGLKISKMTIRRGDSPDDGIQLVTSCAPIYSKYSWWMLFSYELQPKFTVMESSIRHIKKKKNELGLGKR